MSIRSDGRELVTVARLSEPDPGAYRVLFVTNMWPDAVRPFYGSFIQSQAHSLVARGLGLDVIYVRGFESIAAYAHAVPIIARRARADRYDLAHVHYGHTAAASLGIRTLPTVTSFCGEDLLGAPRGAGISRKSRLEVAVFRQVARAATATITKSHEMQERLPAAVRARNHVVPNGVDVERFAPRDRRAARRELGWDPAGRVVLFLGNPDDPRKNVQLARDAFAAIAPTHPDVRLEEAWGVPAERVPALMNAADCLVFPSRSEGSPNAVKEAMASALPTVATPVGDVEERFDGVAGCYLRDSSTSAFADGLRLALRDETAPDARRHVLALSVERVAERVESIYRHAISQFRP